MPPIPIHSNSPISAAKAKEQSTPQTDHEAASNAAPDTTTTAPQPLDQATHSPLKPGQPPVPAPTASAYQPQLPQPPPPTRTVPLAEPDLKSDGPPPPQPGPVPSIQPQPTSQTYQPPNPFIQPPEPAPPHQLSMAPPTTNQAPTHSTSTAFPPAPNPLQPQALPTTQTQSADLSHPPGYRQDPNAAEMTPAQIAAQEQADRENSVLARLGEAAGGSGSRPRTPNNNPMLGGSSGNESSTQNMMHSGAEMGGAAWDATKKVLGGLAVKIGEMESGVWDRVNREN